MPAIKTVIYLDVLLLVNFLVAYFLLQAAGLLSSQHAAFSRMVCASGIASLSALILFAPELSYPAQILYKILTACAVVGVAFGLQGLRRFVTAVCWYAALNILLAGLCIAVILRTGTPLLQTANLTVYLRISPVVLLLLSAASCGAVWLVLHFSGSTPQTTRTIGIEFELCGAPRAAARHTGYWVPPERPRHLPAGAAHQLAGGKRPTAGGSQRLFGAVVPGPAPQYAAGRCQSAGDTLQYRCAARAAAGVCGGGYQHHHRNGDAKPWPHRCCFLPAAVPVRRI